MSSPRSGLPSLPGLAGLLAAALPASALAGSPQGKTWGLGIGGGTWTNGVSIKHMNGDATALQGVIGVWGPGRGGDGIAASGSFLFEQPTFASAEPLELAWNYGLGADLAIWDDDKGNGGVAVGGHGVLGLEVLFVPVPLDLVVEYRPGLLLVPGVGLDLVNFSGHLRFWF